MYLKVMITKEVVQAGRNVSRTYKERLDEEKEEAEQRKKLNLQTYLKLEQEKKKRKR